MQRPLRIGEARMLDHKGQTARTRHGNMAPSVFTEIIVAETQLKKPQGAVRRSGDGRSLA